MLELLQKTPTWVYIIFIILLVFGLKQRHAREATQTAIFSLPVALIIYLIFEMHSSIGINVSSIVCWFAGLLSGCGIFIKWLHSKDVAYDRHTRKFQLPGSWMPLTIMMIIFTVKYIYGAVSALDPQTAKSIIFLQVFSFLNGIFCGIFSARIFDFWTITKTTSLKN